MRKTNLNFVSSQPQTHKPKYPGPHRCPEKQDSKLSFHGASIAHHEEETVGDIDLYAIGEMSPYADSS